MRAKILNAAIDCLYRLGYSEATTAVIAAAAGASRGAMLHHFPTKDELFQEVVEHVFDGQRAVVIRQLETITDPVERFLAVPVLNRDLIQAPSNVAWLEIWMATRSNPDLRARFLRKQDQVEKQTNEIVLSLARTAGVRDEARVIATLQLFRAAARGIGIDAAIRGDVSRVDTIVNELREVFASLLEPPRAGASSRGK